MTDWAISSGDYMRPHRSAHGQPTVTVGLESTTQSWLVGALLEMDSQVSTSIGYLRTALVSASTVTSTALIGVAAEPASSVTATPRIFYPITPETTFLARTRGSTITSTNVGQFYGLCVDSTKNVFLVDLANQQSTSIRVVITGLVDAIGDSGGYVSFKFGVPRGSTVTFGGGAQPLT